MYSRIYFYVDVVIFLKDMSVLHAFVEARRWKSGPANLLLPTIYDADLHVVHTRRALPVHGLRICGQPAPREMRGCSSFTPH